MKPIVLLLSVLIFCAHANERKFSDVNITTKRVSQVSTKAIKSADAAELLASQVPSITLVRRSGIANDIILRGQKRDNINIILDDGKVYGACPNRMDPPTSHVITANIETINVIEGPYDVEHAGTLSGLVNIKTTQPKQGVHGKLEAGAGSYAHKKLSATIMGGNETVRALLTYAFEKSDQYKDGDANTFAQQIDNAIASGEAKAGNAYRDAYRDASAYSKQSIMGKLFFNLSDNQELRLSYTGNRSDDVLYPNTPMDADYDNSDLFNAQYSAKELADFSKELVAKYYYSFVDHPMSTAFRRASEASFPPNMGKQKVLTNHLESRIQGATLKNSTMLSNALLMTLGLDASLRTWEGEYDVNGNVLNPSIEKASTRNSAIFTTFEYKTDSTSTNVGLRYDYTYVKSQNSALQNNLYRSLGVNAHSQYSISEHFSLLAGLGTASRVPDARELYFQDKSGKIIGTPTLKQTTNYEADLGVKYHTLSNTFKTRLFYSRLNDYIYLNSSKPLNKFENINATIYGISLSGTYYFNDTLYSDYGAAYQRGTKDYPLEGQSNTNLADIPPLKGNIALNWNYSDENIAKAELVGANRWSQFDDDNGEQELAAWAVLNLKVEHHATNNLSFIAGIDNLFNSTYAVSNTYKDLTLLSVDPNGDVMLLNEPGRYVYANVSYAF